MIRELSLWQIAAIVVGSIVFPSGAQQVVEIHPGDTIQAKVDESSTGTRFVLKTGVHRLQTINPKDNQVFEGEDGAVLSGARVLTDWKQEGNLWVHGGQTQQGDQQKWDYCLTEDAICRYGEDIFVDDTIFRQVTTLSEVGEGKWYFDYAADNVYMADDPTGHTVEISVNKYAITGSATGVVIRNLVVEKYATDLINRAAVMGSGAEWIVENCEVRYNHGSGVSLTGNNSIIRNCYVHHQGQTGIAISGTGGLAEGNELAYNSVPEIGFDGYWWGASCKFAHSRDLIVRDNYSHDNWGPGLWTDIDNHNTTYEGNIVENNGCQGIFHEISYSATIRCNIVRNNGWDPRMKDWVWGGQIQVANSEDVEIYGNVVEVHSDYGNAITVSNQDRGDWHSRNIYVYNNDVTFMGERGLMGADADYNRSSFWIAGNVRYEDNTYHLATQDYYYFKFAGPGFAGEMSPMLTYDQWQAMEQDAAGNVDTDLSQRVLTGDCAGWNSTTEQRDTDHQTLAPALCSAGSRSTVQVFALNGRLLFVRNAAEANGAARLDFGGYSRGKRLVRVKDGSCVRIWSVTIY